MVRRCSWVRLEGRDSSYFQGVLVGVLAESDPDLASRVDGLNHRQIRRLRDAFCRRRQLK